MTIISEFTGSPAIPELGLKTVDLKLEVHSFQTDFRDLQTLEDIGFSEGSGGGGGRSVVR